MVPVDDIQTQSVIDLAVHFGAKILIVAGHTGCGGVKLALEPPTNTTASAWVQPIRDMYEANKAEIDGIAFHGYTDRSNH
jgi:carbonic anhydrase